MQLTVDPILGLLVLIAIVAAFAVGKWWALRRPDPEVMALKAAAKLLKPFTEANTPEALADLQRFQRIGQNRGAVVATTFQFAFAQKQAVADAQLAGDIGQRALVDQIGAQPRQFAFAELGEAVVEHARHGVVGLAHAGGLPNGVDQIQQEDHGHPAHDEGTIVGGEGYCQKVEVHHEGDADPDQRLFVLRVVACLQADLDASQC